jgi:hypothetical protein
VFQSFSAYSAPLMRLNEEFYFSPKAPRYVLLQLSPIDDRFPPLEDALLLRHILASYDLLTAEGATLLLRSNGRRPAEPALLREGTARKGEHIELDPHSDKPLWLELNIKPTLAGRLRAFLFKPPIVHLRLWRDPAAGDSEKLFQAPPPMLAAGFLADPVVLNTSALTNLLRGNKPRQAPAYSLEPEPGTDHLWEPRISYRVYSVPESVRAAALPFN